MSIEKKHDSVMSTLDGALSAVIDYPWMEKEGGSIYDHPEYDVISEAVMALVKRLAAEGLIDDVF